MSGASTVWRLPDLLFDRSGRVEVHGDPTLVETTPGGAVRFDGKRDALVVNEHPLEGAHAFTIEARIRPEAAGPAEQRFVHVQGDDGSRALLELRTTREGWYGDVFAHFPEGERYLNDPERLHPFRRWHTLALVCTGRQLRQYINGALELSAPVSAGALGPGKASIGMRLNGVSPFKGAIAWVRFFHG